MRDLLRLPQVGALLLLALLAGCASEPALESREPPGVPQRIIAAAPSVTEIVFALGLGEKVVGVGDFATWPPEVETKTRIGGLFDPRFEEIVALDPDLAILLPSEASLGEQLAELGIEVLTVPSESLADVETAVTAIAERVGVEAQAEALLESWRAELEPAPFADSPPVALTVTRPPGALTDVLVPGGDTFYDELLERLGVVNVFADSSVLYPQVGAEQWLERQPAAIVELQPKELSEYQVERLLADWQELPEIEAVANGCVHVVHGGHTLLPGPRLPRLYREIRAALAECLPEEVEETTG